MTYDRWKTTEPEEWSLEAHTKEQIASELAEIEKDIAWNEHRLVNLVFNDEDKQQTADYIDDLRQERQKLLAVLKNG